MRFLSCVFLLAFLATALAWTKEDYEIFDLVSAIENAEGKGTTFYSWLDVSSTATSPEISKAYRKKSVALHPDKNPGLKGAHERFARLGVVAKILRDQEGRKRYDFFYKNGVPRWRGTGYYYSRWRPGLGSVSVFLIILTSGIQHIVQRMTYTSDLARINRIINDARLAAWGSKMIPVEGQRKVKINIGGKGYLDEDGTWVPGKLLELVVDAEHVYIPEPDGSLLPLDSGVASPAGILRTWFVKLLMDAFHRIRGRPEPDEANDLQEEVADNDTKQGSESDGSGSGTSTPDGISNGHMPTIKAGGRRRKGVKKSVQKS